MPRAFSDRTRDSSTPQRWTSPSYTRICARRRDARADAGNADAQYALATFYKEGRGVAKDLNEAARLLEAASLADHLEAQVEYAIALVNGTGVAKNAQAAIALFRKAARRYS